MQCRPASMRSIYLTKEKKTHMWCKRLLCLFLPVPPAQNGCVLSGGIFVLSVIRLATCRRRSVYFVFFPPRRVDPLSERTDTGTIIVVIVCICTPHRSIVQTVNLTVVNRRFIVGSVLDLTRILPLPSRRDNAPACV